MPYVSDRQRRYMHWAKSQGKISPKVVEEFDRATPKGAKLPEKAPEHGPQNEPPQAEVIEKGAAMQFPYSVMSQAMLDEFSQIIKEATEEKDAGLWDQLLRRGGKKVVQEAAEGGAKKTVSTAAKAAPKAPAAGAGTMPAGYVPPSAHFGTPSAAASTARAAAPKSLRQQAYSMGAPPPPMW